MIHNTDQHPIGQERRENGRDVSQCHEREVPLFHEVVEGSPGIRAIVHPRVLVVRDAAREIDCPKREQQRIEGKPEDPRAAPFKFGCRPHLQGVVCHRREDRDVETWTDTCISEGDQEGAR